MKANTPYTYIIGWSKLQKYYYGVRYSKDCHPKDLFTTYFTSSTYVQEFIEKHGLPDIIRVTRTFENSEKAVEWEIKFLTRVDARKNPKFLNRSNTPYGPSLNFKGNFTDYDSAKKGFMVVREKYGSNGSGVPQTKEKVYTTNISRYGVHHTLGTDKVRLAREKANLEKYGNINPFASKKYYENRVNPMHIPKFREEHAKLMRSKDWSKRGQKTKQHMMETYGVSHYYQSEEFRDKMNSLKRKCPFGCRSNHLYDVGNLSNHMIKVHEWTKSEVLDYREKEIIYDNKTNKRIK